MRAEIINIFFIFEVLKVITFRRVNRRHRCFCWHHRRCFRHYCFRHRHRSTLLHRHRLTGHCKTLKGLNNCGFPNWKGPNKYSSNLSPTLTGMNNSVKEWLN